MVGDGDKEEELQKYSFKLGIQNRIVFLGYQEKPMPSMEESDLLILPSKEERLGRVIVEAMHLGTPVIGSRIGGIPEVIEHEVNGLLVTLGDVNSYTNAMSRILRDKIFRKNLTQNGFYTVKTKFNSNIYQEKLEHLYENLLTKKYLSN